MSRPFALYPSDQGSMLFAQFLDAQLRQSSSEKFKELVSTIIGGIQAVKFSPEIDLVGSICYYLPTLIVNRATLGQSFCGMKLHEVVTVNGINKLKPPTSLNISFPNQIDKTSPPSVSTMLLDLFNTAMYRIQMIDQHIAVAAILQSLLPYIYARRTSIWSFLVETTEILLSPELTDNASSHTDEFSSDDEAMNQITIQNHTSIFTVIFRAFINSLQSIASETEARMERIISFISDVHLCFFFINGDFLEMPLRLTNLQPFMSRSPKVQLKLKVLAWLLGFRISCFLYYAIRVLLVEIDKEMVKADSNMIDTNTNMDNESQITPANVIALTCSVCLDTVQHPSALPCGHICCWDCIIPYAIMVKNRGNQSETSECRCPVCRSEFLPQDIRALQY